MMTKTDDKHFVHIFFSISHNRHFLTKPGETKSNARLIFMVYGQVARTSSRPKSGLRRAKWLVKSPKVLCYVARNFILLSNILVYRACLF